MSRLSVSSTWCVLIAARRPKQWLVDALDRCGLALLRLAERLSIQDGPRCPDCGIGPDMGSGEECEVCRLYEPERMICLGCGNDPDDCDCVGAGWRHPRSNP